MKMQVSKVDLPFLPRLGKFWVEVAREQKAQRGPDR